MRQRLQNVEVQAKTEMLAMSEKFEQEYGTQGAKLDVTKYEAEVYNAELQSLKAATGNQEEIAAQTIANQNGTIEIQKKALEEEF